MTTLLTYNEAGEFLRRSPATLRGDVMRGKIPYVKIGRQVRFSREDLSGWLESKKHGEAGHGQKRINH